MFLQKLKLTTLIERRARGDLIEVFKTFRGPGHCNYGSKFFIPSCSGMNIRLGSDPTAKVNLFQARVVKFWNKLDNNVKKAENVVDFKILLESFKQDKIDADDCIGQYWELSEEMFCRIDDHNRDSYVNFMVENPYIAKKRNINIA